MKKKTNIIVVCLIFICMITSISCYAAPNTITKENLELALNKVVEGEENTKIISITEEIISMEIENQNYKLKYNLGNNPQFILETYIEKGMSYEEYEKKTNNNLMPHTLAYTAVANIQGIEKQKAMSHFMFSYISNGMDKDAETIVVINDLGGAQKEEKDDPNVFYTSEFEERIMEYVNKRHKDTTISDSSTYELKYEKKDITEISCKLVTTLSVNLNAMLKDFNEGEETKKEDTEEDNIDNNLNNSVEHITKENADYFVRLQVGETYEFKEENNMFGADCIIEDNGCVEIIRRAPWSIKGIKAGVVRGYVEGYILESELETGNIVEELVNSFKKKTIYIEVTEKENTSTEESKNNAIDDSIKNEETPKNNTESNSSKLPQTGTSTIIYMVIFISLVGICFTLIKLKKYKDI